MKTRHFVLSGLTALSFAFVGCGGSSDGGGASSSTVAIDDVPKLYAQALCSAQKKCFGDVLDLFLAGESCTANFETAIGDELPKIKQGIDDGTVSYDGTKMQACFDAIAARGCNLEGEPPECTAAIDGTVAIGGDCQMNVECAGADTYCKSSGTCPGACAKREQAGSDCNHDDDCAAGLKCSGTTSKCVKPAAAGEACGGGGTAPDCQSGTFCVGSDDQGKVTGTCDTVDQAFSGKQGDECYFGGKPLCTTDLRCIVESVDTTTGSITAKCGPPVSSGAACKVSLVDACPADEYCKVPQNMLDGTCTPKPKSGEACVQVFEDPICGPGLRCDDGTCRPLQHLGASCAGDDVCYSGNCVGGGCVSAGGCQ